MSKMSGGGLAPYKLVAMIASFAVLQATPMDFTARPMTITSVSRYPVGTVQSVDLAFGADNGAINRLYVAYGDSDGGTSIKNWQNFTYLGEVTGETNSWHTAVPTSRFCRFFLIDSSKGTPLKWVTSQGNAYVDTGFTLKGGDTITLRLRLEAQKQMSILGTRKTVNDGNIAATFTEYSELSVDYCNGSYDTYRMKKTCPTNTWYDVVLSASERSIHDASGALIGANTALCEQQFETEGNCWLFGTSGSPVYSTKMTGSIASFEVVRDGSTIAAYQPFRWDGTCGFIDWATSNFIAAASGTFSGEDDDIAFSPFATATDVLTKEYGTEIMRPREVSVVSIDRSGDGAHVQLAFGPDNGCSHRLYAAYGDSKGGNRLEDWENVQFLGVVYGATNSWRTTMPASAKFCRFFLFLPFDGDDAPISLQYLTGNGSGHFDTGFKLHGGDSLSLGCRPKASRDMSVLGTRQTVNSGNIVVSYATHRTMLDYCNGNYNAYRLATRDYSTLADNWYDIVLSASERSVHDASGAVIGANTTSCDHQFETEENCWLFAASGNPSLPGYFAGDVAYFTVKRGGLFLASYRPCRIGEKYGFYDLANGVFVSPADGTFTGVEDISGSSPLVFVTETVRLIKRGFVLSFR